ncbi:lipid II flippase MurJ [Sphingomonas sp. CFBP 13706]|uniref:lipid II flippase MurJ n=1 Tax=Sphingomonas sp. CFBP 13706 TaxID=2775314 RepID=UPI001FD4719E|nr:lipid II flippase MurJ [Sphingomonas sp. CFBP 13706]
MVTGCGVGGSLVNFAAQAIIASRFGAGQNVDTYVFSLGLPTFLAGLLATCVSYIAVPEITRATADPEHERRLSGRLLRGILVLAATLGLGALPALLLQPALLLPTGSTIRDQPQLPLLIILAWTTGGVQLVNALLIARLNAVGRQITAAMLSLPPGIVSILVLLTIPLHAIWVVAAGVLTGTLAVTLVGWWVQRDRFCWRSGSQTSGAAIVAIRSSVWLSVVALTCFSSYAVIDSFWAPRTGQGALAALGYAQRILIGAGNLVILGPSAIAVPILARIAVNGDVVRFRQTLALIVLSVGGAAGLIALGILGFSDEIVFLLFQRGAFDAAAAQQVASALAHLAPGMAAMLVGVMLMRAIFCIPDSFRHAAIIGLGWSVLYFALSGVFAKRGVTGIADAYSLAWITMAVVGSVILWQRAGALQSAGGVETSSC